MRRNKKQRKKKMQMCPIRKRGETNACPSQSDLKPLSYLP